IRERQLRERGLDPDHVRRVFRKHYGMSFSAFQRSVRLGAALGRLRKGTSMSRTAREAGYASESGFREAFERLFGVTPGAAQDGADGAGAECLHASWMATPLGPMLAIASERG